MSTDLRIERAPLDAPAAAALMRALDEESQSRYPFDLSKHFRVDPDEFAPGRGLFVLAMAGGEAVGISFALRQAGEADRVLLRSRVPAGRRFELARLLGDRLLGDVAESLHPATRSTTYRQKAQRAFAAELLSPFAQVWGMLDGDFSAESQQEVAEHFKVSELTIRTQLVNHRILDRDELESEEFSIAA